MSTDAVEALHEKLDRIDGRLIRLETIQEQDAKGRAFWFVVLGGMISQGVNFFVNLFTHHLAK